MENHLRKCSKAFHEKQEVKINMDCMRRSRRAFWTSFFVALLIIALLYGMADVDFQCRRIEFGDGKTLIFRITGKNPYFACIGHGYDI